MNLLVGYGSDSDDDSNERSSEARKSPKSTTTTTNLTTNTTTNTRTGRGIFVDLPPPTATTSESVDASQARHQGRIGSRLREKPSESNEISQLVAKFAPADLANSASFRDRERELALAAKDDEELERELHHGSSLAQKRTASAARAAAIGSGPLFSALLPPPKRSRQTVGVDDVLKPADDVELPSAESTTPADASRAATQPPQQPPRVAAHASTKPSFASSLVAELESSYVSNSGPAAAVVFANPKFDPANDLSAVAVGADNDSLLDLPASFVGRRGVPVGVIQDVSAASLLAKTSAEQGMEAPQMGEQFTGFAHSDSGKRRGQISYLAHHAIANQKELENKWREGGQARKQSRSRYGF